METTTKTKELIRPMPVDWWLKNPAYLRFMIRDLTSVFIAAYCIFLMVVMYKAQDTETAGFKAFYDQWDTLGSGALHLVALAFAVYHSVTFFNLTPRVMVVYRGEEKVPERVIAGAHFFAWLVVSLVLILIALG